MTHDVRRTLLTLAERLGVEPREGEFHSMDSAHDMIFTVEEPLENKTFPALPEPEPEPAPPQYDIATDQWEPQVPQTPVAMVQETFEPDGYIRFSTTAPTGVQTTQEPVSSTQYWNIKQRKVKTYSLGEILNALLDRIDCVNSVRAWNCDPKVDNNGRAKGR